MKSYQLKSILLIVLLGAIVYFNYPSFQRFFFTNGQTVASKMEQKFSLAEEVINSASTINLALPDVKNNRIELLVEDSFDKNKSNVALEKIIGDVFKLEKTADKHYLVQQKFDASIFISDYSKQINDLATNAKKIKSFNLSEDKESVVFNMEPGKRLSLVSTPISLIFGDGGFDWLYDKENSSYQARIADSKYLLSLGLDLKGGTYLDVGIDQKSVINTLLQRNKTSLTDALKVAYPDSKVDIKDDKLIVTKNAGVNIDYNSSTELGNLTKDFDISKQGSEDSLTPNAGLVGKSYNDSLDQAITIIRDRIDLLGVKDPTIQKRGTNSIVVQVPGQTDSTRIKDLITQAANLEFRFVTDKNAENSQELSEDRIDPVTKEVLSSTPVYVEKHVAMRGDAISDARVAFNNVTGVPEISFSLKPGSATLFGDITAQNIGRNMAIILDAKVKSAPRINQAIYGGQGSITGQFSVDEARDLAIVLRSGALPTSLTIEEERVIGASLGDKSVRDSIYSFIVGFTILTIFLIVYYRASGIIAVLTLLINLFLILAVLAFFGATLTLPGIAGIILTIAMAVDANVLIYERIREELAHEASARKAIGQGFSRVAVTVLDANITTLIVSAVLFQLGTGPIRGFALTLAIGIFSTLFSSLVVSHWMFDIAWLRKKQLTKISI